MLKLTFREIRTSFGRFLAIFAIIALGAGFFCGLKLTKTSMLHTLDLYVSSQRMFDYDLVSTVGFGEDDAAKFEADSAVSAAEGSRQTDMIFDLPGGSYVLHTISVPEKLNLPMLTAGRLPENESECALDAWFFDESIIGTKITMSDDNDGDDMEDFTAHSFTVTGLCKSPLYINYERGGTSLGSGSITAFVYLSPSAYDTDYYTRMYLTLEGVSGNVYTDEYDDFVEAAEDHITELTERLADERYVELKTDAEEELADARKKLDDAHADIEDAKRQMADAHADIEDGKQKIADGEEEYADAVDYFNEYKHFMEYIKISENTVDFAKKQTELDDARDEIDEHRQELEDAEKDLARAEVDLAEAEQDLADAEEDYAEGEDKLNDLEAPECYVLNRRSNVGYVCFESDSDIVNAVAKVFPLFFFLVAALVCITTMTRMVDEQRTQLGVLKATGYSDRAIMFKFLLYSALASVLGCAGGIAVCSVLLPKAIWQGYNIMYGFTEMTTAFDWKLAVISSAAYLACSLAATWFACRNELSETAASLIRPRAPKAGKRILLERVGFIWNRIPFLHKVSIRNILRYKQRMFMMILGIGGCTALVLTGYGIKDSIRDVVGYQFEDISHYDCSLNFKDDMSEGDRENFRDRYKNEVSDMLFMHDVVMDCSTGDITKTAHVVVTENDSAGDYMEFVLNGETVEYPKDGECIISVGLSQSMNLNKGDRVLVMNDDKGQLELTVAGVFNNYVYNYLFITRATYVEGFGCDPEIKCAWLRIDKNADIHETAAKLNGDDDVASSQLTEDLKERMSNMMSALDYIVLLVVICAGALAFIVLYNLTNISITERIREIATVKVLGFYDNETSSYVFRENVALTVIGALVGIPMGFALHAFVMEQIKIDMVHFDVRILPLSIAISLGLTMAFALVVDLVLKPRLRRIDMAQALKSIE